MAPLLVTVSSLGPFVGGILGALFGTWLALHRFRSERALDRRLQWYESMFRVAEATRAAAVDTASVLDIDPKEDPDERLEELSEQMAALDRFERCADNFHRLSPERDLFALHGAREALLVATAMMVRLDLQAVGCPTREYANQLREMARVLYEARNELAREFRADLIPAPWLARVIRRLRRQQIHPALRD